ncbi:MAG: iron-sulfur cluster assembly scaffold protein, partial [Elusimicrobia bacterium]|nr:iron-sulfur cluster assembly scaffold protein [Elusimicrobiota bacterium]
MPLDRQISMEEAAIKYSGELDKPDGISDVTGPCGDKMGFSLVVSQGRISAIKFRATGCSVTQACGAVVAFTADQLSLSEALFISQGY